MLGGCGGAEPQRAANPLVGPLATPVATDADRAEIAALINEVRVAFAAGEGADVCDRLTARGAAEMTSQDVVPFIEDEVEARIEGEPLEPTCEAAVSSFTEGLTDSQRRQLAGVLTYRVADVDPAATAEGYPGAVRVTCLESPGKAWFATQEDGTWKLELPFCSTPPPGA
ncbi:MAG: hypothetical protein U0R24_05275 [Solirubrobacterales bacterium]